MLDLLDLVCWIWSFQPIADLQRSVYTTGDLLTSSRHFKSNHDSMLSIKEQIDDLKIEKLIKEFEEEEGRRATFAEVYQIVAEYYGE